jgi:hypothetical protein
MAQEKTDAQPVQMRSCVLETGAEGVRFIVEGRVVKVVPFDTYEAFHKNLTRGLEFNIYPLDIGGGAEIKVQLSPLSEIRAGKIVLHSLDGVTYGRQYRLASVDKEADGRSYAVVVLADTGEVVEREPWDDFKRRIEVGRCRGGTAYGTMLGEVNPRLYFDVTGQLYKSEEERRKDKEAESAQAKAVADEEKNAEAETPDEESLLRLRIAAVREWLRARPRLVYIAAVVSFLVLILGIVLASRGPSVPKPTLEVMSPANLDYFLNQQYEVARALNAVDLAKYAKEHPQAAQDSVRNLAEFMGKARYVTGLTAEQTRKLLFISDILPKLQSELAKAPQK